MSSIWSRLINLAGNITGILPVANGGTGLASGTSGGVLAYTAAGTLASSGALTASAIVVGGGAGVVPTSLALGSANQVVGMNSGATANEYKTLAVGTSGTDFAVANAANSVTFNLPDAGASARGAVTTGTQTLAGAKTFSSATVMAGATVGGSGSNSNNLTLNGRSTSTFTDNAGEGYSFENTNTTANSNTRCLRLFLDGGNDMSSAIFVQFNDSGGQIGSITAATATTVAYNTSSDGRLKENLRPFPDALATLNKVKVHSFDWKETGDEDRGVVAQELFAVYKYPVSRDPANPDHPWQIDYGKLTPLLLAAVQELAAKVEKLEAQLDKSK